MHHQKLCKIFTEIPSWWILKLFICSSYGNHKLLLTEMISVKWFCYEISKLKHVDRDYDATKWNSHEDKLLPVIFLMDLQNFVMMETQLEIPSVKSFHCSSRWLRDYVIIEIQRTASRSFNKTSTRLPLNNSSKSFGFHFENDVRDLNHFNHD